MRKILVKVLIALVAVLFSSTAIAQFYNGSQMEFGKNRVQFDEFLWSFYRFDKFDTYFYPGGKELAVYTAKTANAHIKDLESIFDYELDAKIQFIVYNKQSHFRQSNLGLGMDDQNNIGGVTRIMGSKVFVYFEGDHAKLDAQIRSGIAEVLVNEMIYGNDWREIMKNSTLLVLPEWYIQGLISFVSEPWNMRVENEVKDGILSNRYKKFNRLSGPDAVAAGHSMWHFIAETYGYNVISNIIYMTHVSRNIESGFLFVLGSSLSTLTEEWQEYYTNKYAGIDEQRNLPTANRVPIRTKKSTVYSQAKVSPDGRYVAFVSNDLGQYRVHLYDREKNRTRKILKEGHRLQRINDYSYPLLAWHPSGDMLAIMLEEQAKPQLMFYSMEDRKKERRPVFILDKVLGFDYSHDGRNMVFSGVFNGKSDIYTYNIAANTQQQITNDIYDDLNPRFINNSKQIVFSSNRTDDTLRKKNNDIEKHAANKDIFIYTIGKNQNVLHRVTNTPNIDEVQPDVWEGEKITYLSNQNRVYNRFVAEIDSVISHIDTVAHYRHITRSRAVTNYPRHILDHSTEPAANKLSEVVFFNGRHHLYVHEIGEIPGQDFQNFDEMPFPLNNKKAAPKSKAATSITIPRQSQPSPQAPQIEPDLEVQPAEQDTSRRTKFQSIRVFDDEPQDTALIDINNYEFNEHVKRDQQQHQQQQQQQQQQTIPKVSRDTILLSIIRKESPDDFEEDEEEFVIPNLRPYSVTYYTDKIVTQVDNNFTNLSYQPYTGGAGFINPGMNALIKVGVSDLFEDRKIVGGFRLSPSLTANEYFLSYENLTKRLDRQTIFHRRGILMSDPVSLSRIHTHEI
nr:PD40 domain-containing protein [Bacteroidota bacterium]